MSLMKYRLPSSVKGVNFYGPKSEFIVSGSDCSNVFLWEAQSEEVINYFHSDNTGLVSGRKTDAAGTSSNMQQVFYWGNLSQF